MKWPLSQDFNESIQSPASAFRDPDLKTGTVETSRMGIPIPRSGNFADVYKLQTATGRVYAIKCFTRPVLGLQLRYYAIAQSLREKNLPFLINFDYQEEGIRVKGKWFPIVKMEWVEGFTLNTFVRDNLPRPDVIDALLRLWVRLCSRLRLAQIAHADLQHGNVLLVPGDRSTTLSLKLIDYDGMWVPSLQGQVSGEYGHASYQHPERLPRQIYSAEVDRFPHLVIACALRASILAGPRLWKEFDNGDNLLFRESDFTQPRESALARTLWALDDPTVTNLLSILILSAQRSLDQTPWLDELLKADAPKISDRILSLAAEAIGVQRRTAREAVVVTVQQSAGLEREFAEMITAGESTRTQRRRERGLVSLLTGVGAVTLIGGGIGVGWMLMKKDPPDSHVEVLSTDGTTDPATKAEEPPPVEPMPPVKEQPVPKKGPPESGKAEPFARRWNGQDVRSGDPPKPREMLFLGAKLPLNMAWPQVIPQGQFPLGAWLSSDGHRVIGALPNKIVSVSSDARQSPNVEYDAKSTPIRKVLPNPQRSRLAIVLDTTILCWSLTERRELWSFQAAAAVRSLAWTEDGDHLAASIEQRGFIEWKASDGTIRRSDPQRRVDKMRYSHDGSRMLAIDAGGALELWDLESDKKVRLNHPSPVRDLAISSNATENLGVTLDADNRIVVWQIDSGIKQYAIQIPTRTPATVVEFGSDSDTLLIGTKDGQILKYELGRSTAIASPTANDSPIINIDVIGDFFLAGSSRQSILGR